VAAKDIPKAMREKVKARAGRHCERCAIAILSGEIHHRKNRSQGGEHTLQNLVFICKPCHDWIGAHPHLAGVEGYHVKPWCDPATVSIILHRAGKVMLTGDGQYQSCS
jgi:5-methylcytosine-specific restriction endonuclease McrA